MNELIVDLNISAEQYLRLYRGEVESVVARTLDGRTVRFPANALRGYITRNGITGRFRIRYGSDGKLVDIQRL
ncbi:DUF2835 domain-containing protein [Marinobacterium sp. D7]|uniref:DUF2835 domain-containing protein n=1 Tax=Marinobacterium ramblicola TaxID=2849041 RepID=UPI001C2D650F|nr:DUF2835 domain-containing protein [Marinobacterium ramblicola]MBV1789562.1 DUF2835 domain-containing protein [Marinobacterium ramblicola]